MLRASLLAALALALLVPASAAAARPGVTTGAAADVGQTTVTLTGRVDPNGKATVYFFQYGPTALYGALTPEVPGGAGANPRAVTVPVTGLAPFTTYHYRLVARNADGLTRGARRTFRTQRQPLGLTLGANPAQVAPGGATTLVGNLGGTGNAGRQVVLQANPFPFTQGFLNAGNPLVTDAAGNFSFPVLSVPITTQYRVQMPNNPGVISPIVTVPVLVQVSTTLQAHGAPWPPDPRPHVRPDLAAAQRRGRADPEAARGPVDHGPLDVRQAGVGRPVALLQEVHHAHGRPLPRARRVGGRLRLQHEP